MAEDETAVSKMNNFSNRREYLKAGAAGAAVALAGCLGNGEGGPEELTASIHEEGTGAFAAAQAHSSVLDNATDEFQLDVRPSSSIRENIGRMDRGEADIAYVGNWELANLLEGNEPYEDVEITPQQLVIYTNATWILVTNDEDVETVEDLEGMSIGAGPEGAAVNQIVRRIFDLYDVDAEFANVPFGEKQGAMSEGVIDAVALTLNNFEVVVPWAEQVLVSEDAYLVDWPDDGQKIIDDDLISEIEWTSDQLPDSLERTPDGEYTSWNIAFFLAATEETSESAVSEFMNETWANIDELIETSEYFGFHSELDHWTTGLVEDGPFHPAAEEFYQEHE